MKFAILLVFVNQIDTSLAKEPRNSKVCKFQFSTHVLLTYFLKYEKKKTSTTSLTVPVFQVVRFPNDVCISSGAKNGTCYTT